MTFEKTLRLTDDDIEALGKYDTPAIANAIEAFDVRDPTEGFTSLELRCMYPEYPPVVGYAVTCIEDTSSPLQRGQSLNSLSYEVLYEAIAEAPKPAIVVFKNVGPNRRRGCHMGDVMATAFRKLGVVAAITDGGVRDLEPTRERVPGFQMFAAGTVVSHGVPKLVEVGVTVSIFGLMISPGTLLHGDASGVVSIPMAIADQVAGQAESGMRSEQEEIRYINGSDFSLEEYFKKYNW